ncbi:MAG: class I SAM-dependent methyltransferase [Bacteroidota bacterium]|jgi:SAM-dependent methyltransferase|nr:methyltransferase domain-containing protein [Bacteroidota bacterium]MCA6441786.1 methyltransferase domain-containing protein [Bacteroidota bacterium]
MRLDRVLRRKLFWLLNTGNNVECTYCGKTFKRFMAEGVKSPVFQKYKVAGGGYKENVYCPNCYSVDRSRLLKLFFELRTNVYKQPTNLLHISPNKEIANALIAPTIKQTVGTIEPEMYAEYKPVYMDIQDIKENDNTFDVVVCCHVIEHVDDAPKAMREIYRVLKKGGFAVLQVPLAINLDKTIEDLTLKTDKERKLKFGQTDHVRLFGLDYFDKLTQAGFRVDRDNPFTNKWIDEKLLKRYSLDPIEDVIVCHKD